MRGELSLDGYARLVGGLLARGYQVRGYADAEPGARHLILRHDVDMSIEHAVRLAEREVELGVRATYFALMRSELYNPFSGRGRAGLARLLALGHAVGLHFDASLYPPGRAALETACAEECAWLEGCLSRAVEVVSFHRPARSLLDSAGAIAGRLHAYQPRYFRDMGYCSDSRGAFHHGHPFDHPAVAEGRALQLLTHPIWWVAQPGESPVDKLDRLAAERHDAYRRELAANCEPYRAALGSAPGGEGGA
jgi:hypothetical protein